MTETKVRIGGGKSNGMGLATRWWDGGGATKETVLVTVDGVTYKFLAHHSERVKRGADWLDANFPGWYMNIDTDTLDLNSTGSCILGQEFTYTLASSVTPDGSNYEAFLKAHFDGDREKGAEHGFDMGDDEVDHFNHQIFYPDSHPGTPLLTPGGSHKALKVFWEYLGVLWIKEINERKARDERAVDVVMTIAESKPEILDKLGA